MRRVLSLTLILIFAVATFSKRGSLTANENHTEVEAKKELVDIKADVVYPHKLGRDSTVLCFVGNFAAQHNGAIITADSAVRYGDERIDCFGNVLINKNTTYAYADKAIYNGARNIVTLYSPIVKVIDEGVTLYAYNFRFNTLDNVGFYWDGGVTTNQDSSKLESMRGYYYADTKDLVGVDDVEISTTEYDMKGDSVRYNMQSGYAEFFERTNIWNSNGEYLFTHRGNYDKNLARFSLTDDGYMLNREQEAWSDSMDYFRDREEVILRGNIQLDDTTNKMLVYGDYAHYWGDVEKIFLSRKPLIVGYDTEQSDSMFMRADTIIITTHKREAIPVDSLALAAEESSAEEQTTAPAGDVNPAPKRVRGASSGSVASKDTSAEQADSLAQSTPQSDSLLMGGDSVRELTRAERKQLKAQRKRARADSLSLVRVREKAAKLDAQKARDARKAEKRKAKMEERMLRRGRSRHHHDHEVDSLKADSLQGVDSLLAIVESLGAADSLSVTDSLAKQDSISVEPMDSIYRIVVGFRNARTLQGAQQSASDSLSLDLSDTTLRLYINPYMWNGDNQVQAEVMDIYTRDGEMDKAVFSGSPIMASMIDTSHFNQVAGRVITSHFERNELVRNEVEGNVRTIYYMLDEESQEITTMTYIESGTATFFFEEQELDGITYRSEPAYIFYPINLIPTTQPTRIDGFEWQGRERPSREMFMDRIRRPSIRSSRESLPRPKFPIENSIDVERAALIDDGMWMDRTDRVAPLAEEWLESLGHKSGQPRKEGLEF